MKLSYFLIHIFSRGVTIGLGARTPPLFGGIKYRSSFENHKNHGPCLLVLLLLVVVVTSASGEAIIGSNDIHGLGK